MKKRLIVLVATIAMVTTIFAGCGKTETKTKTDDKPKVKIGLSTDEGGLNDKSFNQAADTGIKNAAKEMAIDYKAVESKTKDDYQSNLDALVGNGSKLVFGVGFQMGDAITNAAKKYPDTKFAIVDSVVDAENVNSYVFKEQEGSFLMGVIAGKMTKTGKVGFVGGKDFALINKFEVGFAAGVKSVNPAAGEFLTNKQNIIYVDSFTDAAKGKEATKNLINAGCDVIYHAAGGVGEGMFQAVSEAKQNGKSVWAIGVDMDQSVTLPKYANIILSSMIKRVDTATYEASKAIVNGTFKGKTVVELGLKEGGVGIAPTSDKNTPKDVLDLVKKYEDAIKAGSIKVPATREELKAFVLVEVK